MIRAEMAASVAHHRSVDGSSNANAPLVVVLAGTLMIVFDFFIVNVMLPSVQARLRASSGQLEWVIAGYGLPFAVFLTTAGRLGNRFGRRRVFTVGVAVFTLGRWRVASLRARPRWSLRGCFRVWRGVDPVRMCCRSSASSTAGRSECVGFAAMRS